MKPALKLGIAGAAGIAIALAMKNISDKSKETALALQQVVGSSQIIKSSGEVRVVRQEKEIEYWRLEAPPAIDNKTLISWYIETVGEEAFGIVPYRVNDNFGAIVIRNTNQIPRSIRLKVIGLYL